MGREMDVRCFISLPGLLIARQEESGHKTQRRLCSEYNLALRTVATASLPGEVEKGIDKPLLGVSDTRGKRGRELSEIDEFQDAASCLLSTMVTTCCSAVS